MIHGRSILATTLLLAACAAGGPAQDFEAELEAMADRFPGAVESEEALEALRDDLDDLADRIRSFRRENRDELEDAERERLEELEDDADALDDVVYVVGQLSNSADMSLADFERANRRLGLEPEVVRTEESGVEVVRIDVGDYRSYLLRNDTDGNYTLQYGWTTPSMDDTQSGIGSSLCGTLTVFAGLLNSREHDLAGLEIESVRLTDMGAMGAGLGECG